MASATIPGLGGSIIQLRHSFERRLGRLTPRGRRAGVAGIASVAARVINIVAVLVAIRLVSGVLDPQQLGLFVLVVGAQQLVAFSDLGIGNGLVNLAGEALAHDDRARLTTAVSSATCVLLAVAAAISVVFLIVEPHVDWAQTLGVEGRAALEAGSAVSVLVAATAVGLPLAAAANVYLARQEGWIASICAAASSALALIALVVLVRSEHGTVPLAATMLASAPVAGAMASGWLYFHERDLRPRWRAFRRRVASHLLRRGALFFVLAVSISVAYQSDAIILARSRDASAVPTFSVSARLFLLAPMVIVLWTTQLWPAYRDATLRSDLDWVRTTLRRSVVGAAAVSAAASLVVLPFARPVVERFLHEGQPPSWSLLLALCCWAVVSSVSAALAAFLNGLGALRIQAVAAATMAVANLGLSLLLVDPLGATGPVIASAATQTMLVLLPIAWTMRGFLGRTSSEEQFTAWVQRFGDLSLRPLSDVST